MNPLPVPEAMRIGQARLTAGLDRFARIDLAAHRQLFGTIRRLPARQLIELAERADLRGRGGAAFPFARKLRAVLASAAARKSATVIVVNGTEGEPGSAKDAMLLIRSPYLVLGGALLACRALGAREIVVGVAVGAADGLVARSVVAAARAEPELRRLLRVAEVPDRFEGRPAVVEVPTGMPLGTVLDICETRSAAAVLVGGYHGSWLPAEIAYDVPVSRAGLEAAGGSLGAGIVLPLGEDTCPVGEVARIARYLAKESSGQCGPCKLGLPGIARSLSALADGSGGMEALDRARRAASAVRGRGACSHPDGTSRFVLSALEVFTDDLAAHAFRGSCGRPVREILPLDPEHDEARLVVDWTRCQGHGLCGRLVPELVQLDSQGYPTFLDMPVPFWLERDAQQAVEMCPALALRLEAARPAVPPPAALAAAGPPVLQGGLLSDGDEAGVPQLR